MCILKMSFSLVTAKPAEQTVDIFGAPPKKDDDKNGHLPNLEFGLETPLGPHVRRKRLELTNK